MTRRASQTRVFASQWKRRLSIVIELPDRPVVWRMASRTGGTQSAVVNVVVRMTVDACLSGVVIEE